MIVAKSEKLEHIFSGTEVRAQIHTDEFSTNFGNLFCPICGKMVTYNDSPANEPFGFFRHTDGSPDCFETEGTSNEHRLMIELTVKSIHNRINEVTGERVEIDCERWVGVRENFVIADVRVSSPLQIVAETVYKSERLALGRRFNTIFCNGYRSYLIFHQDGRHDVDRVEEHLQQVAPLRVGRFDPETLELTLGDLFSDAQFDLNDRQRASLPNYIVRSF